MFKLTLFRKQISILLVITLVFAGFAMFVSDVAVRAMMSWSVREDTTGGPTQGFVRLIDALTSDGILTLDDAAERINRSAPSSRMIGLSVVDERKLQEVFGIDPNLIPADPFQAHTVREKELRFPRITVFRAKSDPKRYLVFERPEPGPPGRAPRVGGPPPPGGPDHHGPPPIFLWTFSALIISGFLAATICLFLLFSSMRRKARQAADVINAIKQGDWQKRMPIDGLDEVGNLMQEFNRMADEIESAVRAMQRAEAARTGLLQELAHDLRTPIAGLRSLIETLEIRNESLDGKTRGELFSLAQKEIDYFARLVEDLLFLAQVRDPRYLNSGKSVNVAGLLQSQCDRAQLECKSAISLNLNESKIEILGDEVLLNRLLRNAIDNATSFAKSKIDISVEFQKSSRDETTCLQITIQDDGPGFSEQALEKFGEKRFSRIVTENSGDRLSVGLGSVIMTTVASVHGGKVEARNAIVEGHIKGAAVVITLPLA